MSSKKSKKLDKVQAEIEGLIETINSGDKDKKYDNFARAVIIAHYTSFLAIVWKSYDAGVQIPISAKIALVVFGFGIFFGALRFLIDYFTPENIDCYKRLIEIEEEYGDEFKKQKIDDFENITALNKLMKWSFQKGDVDKVPTFSLMAVCFF